MIVAKRYAFGTAEKEVQDYWKKRGVWKAKVDKEKAKRYVLDMFPYPSGAGLHVGHLRGYFASDVMAILWRMKGYQVLHPMGWDAFGLPAEQYAIDTGQHPAVTTEKNIAAYKDVLQKAGLSFDWSREVATTDPTYYRWTQWMFLAIYNSWYDNKAAKAVPITALRAIFESEGNKNVDAAHHRSGRLFDAEEWKAMSQEEQEQQLGFYRLAYLADTTVNWCPALGTVLANDEVEGRVSVRGGHPVEPRKMRQWLLRATAYADRLHRGLDNLDWPEPVKEMQRNWIGKSQGVTLLFDLESKDLGQEAIEVFTTRVETLFGVTFLALSPNHPLVEEMIAWHKNEGDKAAALEAFVAATNRLDRHQEVVLDGIFTGFHAKHPLTGKAIPIWLANYVLVDYGTGAVMGVPAHDIRDKVFALCFDLENIPVITEGEAPTLINSGEASGMTIEASRKFFVEQLQKRAKGHPTIHYRLRDSTFSRQRYWGEPIPLFYKDGIPYPLSQADLPLRLPAVKKYTSAGVDSPLAAVKEWQTPEGHRLESHTMPSWAGSSWYFLRYMDPTNEDAFVDPKAANYWHAVDLYVGGREHATGHLIYARFWNMFLFDRGYVPFEEPFKKLINQGMIQGYTRFVYRLKGKNRFISKGLHEDYDTTSIRIDISMVKEGNLDVEKFKKWRPELADATFIFEDGAYRCGQAVEKMSKSKFNTVDPLPIIENYGVDAMRLYLLFLGPLEQPKPWSMEGIEGMVRFMKKVWRLFHQGKGEEWLVTKESTPPKEALKALHKAIKGVTHGMERFTFNTSISALMICLNRFLDLGCTTQSLLTDFVRLLAPFAPHMAEHLWQQLGSPNSSSVMSAGYPLCDEALLVEEEVTHPVAVNGKVRTQVQLSCNLSKEEIKKRVMALPALAKWLEGKEVKKVFIMPGKMVNIATAK